MKIPDNKIRAIACFAAGLIYFNAAGASAGDKKQPPRRIDILDQKSSISEFVTGAVMHENDMLRYCLNISDAASEARSSILRKTLANTKSEVEIKIGELRENISVLSSWMNKRDEFVAKANNSLIAIFETMRPDAAALQMTELDVGLAAALIIKLEPKISSAIMAEMKPKKAAMITGILTSAIDEKSRVASK